MQWRFVISPNGMDVLCSLKDPVVLGLLGLTRLESRRVVQISAIFMVFFNILAYMFKCEQDHLFGMVAFLEAMDLVTKPRTFLRRNSQGGSFVFLLLWHILHLIIRVLYFVREILSAVESYLITNGIVNAYNNLNIDRVKYLGIVIYSDEARKTSDVIELLEWFSAIGVKNVCLGEKVSWDCYLGIVI